jgi:hypothetical protein
MQQRRSDGVHRLAAVLPYCAISCLNLAGCGVGSTAASALALVLQQSATLTELRLGSNNIDDGGAIELADVLTSNTSLALLHLGYCPIGRAHTAFVRSLDTNRTLCDLHGVNGVELLMERNRLTMRNRKRMVGLPVLLAGSSLTHVSYMFSLFFI